MKIVVLDADTFSFPDSEWDVIASLGDFESYGRTELKSPVIRKRIEGASIVLTNKVPLSAQEISGAETLKMIGVLATGFNIIDLKAADDAGIAVCNVPGYSTESVAQHTLALALHLTNAVADYAGSVRQGDWERSEMFTYLRAPITELKGKTVGIVGFGEIGRRVGQVFHALGCRVLASMRNPRNAPDWEGFAFADNATIFRESDIVTLHCPQTEENKGFVDAKLLGSMKRSAILINTARGTLIDESALADALRNEVIRAAGLDVLAREPMELNHPLRELPNCIITPHVAWASTEARRRLLSIMADNIRAFTNGSPQNVVNHP